MFENHCGEAQLLKGIGHKAGVLSEVEGCGTSVMAKLLRNGKGEVGKSTLFLLRL